MRIEYPLDRSKSQVQYKVRIVQTINSQSRSLGVERNTVTKMAGTVNVQHVLRRRSPDAKPVMRIIPIEIAVGADITALVKLNLRVRPRRIRRVRPHRFPLLGAAVVDIEFVQCGVMDQQPAAAHIRPDGDFLRIRHARRQQTLRGRVDIEQSSGVRRRRPDPDIAGCVDDKRWSI